MAEWINVAEGTSFSSLSQLVKNQNLPSGTPVLVKMNVGALASAFDLWGAEAAFIPFTPPGMSLKDVYGEGSYGYVRLESGGSAWISDMISYILRFWGDVIIGGVKLLFNVFKIVISAFMEPVTEFIWKGIVWPAVLVGGVLLLLRMGKGGKNGER